MAELLALAPPMSAEEHAALCQMFTPPRRYQARSGSNAVPRRRQGSQASTDTQIIWERDARLPLDFAVLLVALLAGIAAAAALLPRLAR